MSDWLYGYVVADFIFVLGYLGIGWDSWVEKKRITDGERARRRKWMARYTILLPATGPLTLAGLALWLVHQVVSGIPRGMANLWQEAFPVSPFSYLRVWWHRWRDPEPAMGPTGEGAYRLSTQSITDAINEARKEDGAP